MTRIQCSLERRLNLAFQNKKPDEKKRMLIRATKEILGEKKGTYQVQFENLNDFYKTLVVMYIAGQLKGIGEKRFANQVYESFDIPQIYREGVHLGKLKQRIRKEQREYALEIIANSKSTGYQGPIWDLWDNRCIPISWDNRDIWSFL